ncbi:FadR/GntR family transcriptional regulator [Desulfosporosinus sp. BICA1-9]|uniref:FadR/GntR family transcriptional regulator n=1 Tax=Desulfosporosinus sp. BICA1-9 TaxID=1531958 RepID=UPI00054B0FAE|nr:FadR/GntR family transcriptional regulator [Desulfosporosinus sp. BICA1-9]KJS81735.1 MAG: GntR family transcriptional regulator [Desulfosporosinus sp. BICA1-9]HBW36118.1 FadR family transcriptional regulator [Desulfosporosinus sp.]
MNLKPIKTRKIYEQIVDQVGHLVAEGQLKPGDRLPSERELVERFQVSRASIREAISALEMMGLIEVRSGEGTYIRQVNIESVITPLAWMLFIETDSDLELYEARKILEVQAAGLAAERADDDEIKDLYEALEIMRMDLENHRLGEDADHQFHYSIARATHNKILIRLMNTLSDTMQKSLKSSRSRLYERGDTPKKLYDEHCKIYEAIKNHDAEKAQKFMLDHLLGVERHLAKYLNID